MNLKVMEKEDIPLYAEWVNDPEFYGPFVNIKQQSQTEIEKHLDTLPEKAKWFIIEKKEGDKIARAHCGAEVPAARLLVQVGFEVVGVDFSSSMLRLARKSVPEATLIQEDMTRLGFRDNTFDGLVALYSIIHVPREMHASLYQSFHRILKPDGLMLICIGSNEWEGEDEYFGARMFWSEYNHEEAIQMVKNAGIQIIKGKHLVTGGERHYWIIARNEE